MRLYVHPISLQRCYLLPGCRYIWFMIFCFHPITYFKECCFKSIFVQYWFGIRIVALMWVIKIYNYKLVFIIDIITCRWYSCLSLFMSELSVVLLDRCSLLLLLSLPSLSPFLTLLSILEDVLEIFLAKAPIPILVLALGILIDINENTKSRINDIMKKLRVWVL